MRIEDTDTRRNTPTAMQQVIADLQWLGIDWDEGPEVDGPNGPYLQSQRRDIYDKYIAQLLEKKLAYYCFDTPEELAAMRDEAVAAKKDFVYRMRGDFPDEAAVEKARVEGRPVTVRFRMPDEDIVVKDIVRDVCVFKREVLSDFIIQKSDGFPTYHFAVVVDDELMEVTHVIRGQEHLMNTPWHQALQRALGFRVPEYAHMSVTMSEGGGKLSKRERPKVLRQAIKDNPETDIEALAKIGGISAEEMEQFLKKKTTPDMPVVDAIAEFMGVHLPEINVVDFFRSGYIPETMINFLALLGWNPGDDREIMELSELIESFDLSRLAKSNSLFDRKKLVSFNTEHIKMTSTDKMRGYLRDYLEENDSPVKAADDELLERLIRINAGARTLEDIEQKSRFLFVDNNNIEYDDKAVKKVLKGGAFEILGIIADRLGKMDELTPENIEGMLRGLAEEKEVGLGKVAQPLRVAICGNTVSPPIFDSVDMLGVNNTLERIRLTISRFENES